MIVMAALVAVALYFIIPPSVKTHLGLDLQGGLEVVYTAKTADGKAPTAAELDQTIGILDRRVNMLGTTESAIQKQGTDQISVSLPGIKDRQQALDTIGKTAQLEFYKDDPSSRLVGPVDTKDAALKEFKSQGVSQAEVDQLAANGNTNKHALVTSPPDTANNQPEQWYVYKRPPALSGDAISGARAGFSGQTNKPNVLINFTSAGSKKFQEITRELYNTGLLKNTPQTFAIVLDNVMASDPMIDYTDPGLRDGISGGAEISGGNMTIKESQDLALVLKTGALPVRLAVAEQRQVSATLGKDSLNQGLIAGLVGLGIVLIFERIKEEVRHGKTVRSAVHSGYARGFKTILDANVLTMLTAAVIFVFATASPKGFALTLILGVLVSMLTAVLFTRAMLGVLAGFAFFSNPAFMGVKTSQIEAEAVAEGRPAASRRRRAATVTSADDNGQGAPVPAAPGAATAPGAPSRGASPAGRRTSTTRKKKKRR